MLGVRQQSAQNIIIFLFLLLVVNQVATGRENVSSDAVGDMLFSFMSFVRSLTSADGAAFVVIVTSRIGTRAIVSQNV